VVTVHGATGTGPFFGEKTHFADKRSAEKWDLWPSGVWLTYFRLLGRLAWYCTDLARRIEPESDLDDSADDSPD
jgi:hypothetical protein